MRLMTTLVCILFILGCRAATAPGSQVQSMIGDSNLRLLPLDQVKDGPVLYRALGALTEPAVDTESPEFSELYALCTGIQISPKYVLTAAHCQNQQFVFNKQHIAHDDSLHKLRFKLFGKLIRLFFDGEDVPESNQALHFQTESAPFYASADLDIAIWQFQDLPSDGWIDIRQFSRDWRQLSLLGYPNGVPLTVAEPCHGEAFGENRTRILHNCDSLSGSSGGLVWDTATGLPVALHVQSSGKNNGDYYKEYGTFEGTDKIGWNQAIAWEFILADIISHHPTLAEELKLIHDY